MSQPVNLSNEVYQKLTFFKKKHKHRSFSVAVDELLRAYWSPNLAQVQVQEKFSEMQSWLQSRNLSTDRVEEALGIAQTRVFQGISDKKKADKINTGHV